MLGQLDGAATPTTIVGAFILIAVTLLGLLAWTIKHLFSTTIPDQQKLFTDTIAALIISAEKRDGTLLSDSKEQREANDRNLTAAAKIAREEVAIDRKQSADQFIATNTALIALATGLREEREAIIATIKEHAALINQHTSKTVTDYRHDLNNTINNAVMGRDLAAAKAAGKLNEAEGDQ